MARLDNPWFPCRARFRNPHARLRLFCFSNAGGGAAVYRHWRQSLGETVDVCPVELPGRYTRLREPPYASMPALLNDLADAVRPEMDIPYAFFGYSMGGIIAFELARTLRRRWASSPQRLIVAARPAPEVPLRGGVLEDLPDMELVAEIAERWDPLPQELVDDAEMLTFSLSLMRADLRLIRSYAYTPEAPLRCPIDVLAGRDDASATREELEAWREHTVSTFSLKFFPGGHFFRDACPDEFLAAVGDLVSRSISLNGFQHVRRGHAA